MKKIFRSLKVCVFLFSFLVVLLMPFSTFASEGETTSGHSGVGTTFLWIAVILIVAGLAKLVERKGQPAVLGEILVGVILGNLVLFGIHWFEGMKTDAALAFLAEFGVGILLFQIGLESNITKMRSVGLKAFIVATVGVIAPFVLGYFGSQWLIDGISANGALFIGATLTATSVGITARVLKDLGKLHTKEAQIILGAAVIDDVMGLVILAVVSAIVTTGSVGVGSLVIILIKAIGFLAGAIIVGRLAAPQLSKLFSAIHKGFGMKLALALVFFLVFAFVAELMGLAPIVGAFAAGLVLDPVHFKRFKEPELAVETESLHQEIEETIQPNLKERFTSFAERITHTKERHVEELVETLAFVFTPIFFVMTGMKVNLATLGNTSILTVALMLTAVALVGKLVCGAVTGKGIDRWVVGFGMAPRGEVGLIFANIGLALGVVSTSIFSAVIIVVMVTTLVTPPILAVLLRRNAVKIS